MKLQRDAAQDRYEQQVEQTTKLSAQNKKLEAEVAALVKVLLGMKSDIKLLMSLTAQFVQKADIQAQMLDSMDAMIQQIRFHSRASTILRRAAAKARPRNSITKLSDTGRRATICTDTPDPKLARAALYFSSGKSKKRKNASAVCHYNCNQQT
jgi:hypothetical protein